MKRRSIRRRVVVSCLLLALAACAGVLGLRRDPTDRFPHRAHVVAGISCTRCHDGIDREPRLVAHLPDDATCTSCHTKPHDPRPCAGCHTTPDKPAMLVEAKQHLVFDHGRHLRGPARGNCVRCHAGVADGDERMRPAMATCFGCHDDAQAARRCDTCHTNLVEERTLPQSHLAHDGDWIREHGTRAASSGDLCSTCHTQSSCAKCHGQTAPVLTSELRPADPFRASAHRAGFAARHSLEANADPGACTTCHQVDRCAACHASRGVAGEGARTPHPRNWVGPTAADNLHGREARRDPAACASCHGGAGEMLCVRCHAVGGVGGNPHPPGWSSRQPMTAMPCRLCHPIGAR